MSSLRLAAEAGTQGPRGTVRQTARPTPAQQAAMRAAIGQSERSAGRSLLARMVAIYVLAFRRQLALESDPVESVWVHVRRRRRMKKVCNCQFVATACRQRLCRSSAREKPPPAFQSQAESRSEDTSETLFLPEAKILAGAAIARPAPKDTVCPA